MDCICFCRACTSIFLFALDLCAEIWFLSFATSPSVSGLPSGHLLTFKRFFHSLILFSDSYTYLSDSIILRPRFFFFWTDSSLSKDYSLSRTIFGILVGARASLSIFSNSFYVFLPPRFSEILVALLDLETWELRRVLSYCALGFEFKASAGYDMILNRFVY